jgi:hypothetical protein
VIAPSRPLPTAHPDPEIDLTRGYISAVVLALTGQNVEVDRSWLDPRDPIDATILMESMALVWDEWHGWTAGRYVSGAPGERTALEEPVPLGGGIALDPAHVAHLVKTGRVEAPVRARSRADARDGLFDTLKGFNAR